MKSAVPFPGDVIDMNNWTELGLRLAIAGPEKYEELLAALEQIVDAQETIAVYDRRMLFGIRASGRSTA